MPHVEVRPVVSRSQRRTFLRLPWRLYRDDPNWIPPLLVMQKEMLGFAPSPFYQRNTIQPFLAYREGEPVGRIAAIVNRGHNERYEERRGFWGFFESIDEQPVADALFDAVRRWCDDQGIFRLRGPVSPSLNHELGLLIDGFDTPPKFMMTHNPPYYERLVESYGFRKAQDLYAFWGHVSLLPKIQKKLGPMVESLKEHYNVVQRPLDRGRFLEEVETFLDIYNRSLVNTWGFVPMSPEEVRHTARGLRWLIVPELAVAVELDGRVVGATFGMLDYNPRIKAIDGRLLPFGFIRLLWNKRAIKAIRVISTNVLPEYQRMGFGLLLMNGIVPAAVDWEIEEAEFSWVLESNRLSYGSLKKGGAEITKTYRLYDLDAEPAEVEPQTDVVRVGPPWEPRETSDLPQRSWELPAGLREGRLEVQPVESRRQFHSFIHLPWSIYADDPHWVPPLVVEVKEFLDRRKHPFYIHGEAQPMLATRDGKPVGRLIVSDDPHYNKQQGSNTGCFGMFECHDDPEAAAALLDAAGDWLRQRGRSEIMGPIDYSTNYHVGLLVDGFDTPPLWMMNHHRPYYARLLEQWRLTKVRDMYAWWFDDPKDLVTTWGPKLERIVRRAGVTIRPFRRGEFDAEVERCRAVYNQSRIENWGFVTLSEAEFRYVASRLARFAVAEQVLIAEKDGQPVGFSITLPDYNEAIRPLNGRLTHWGLPTGAMRLARQVKNIRTARMLVLGVLEHFRRRGIAEQLILQTLDYGKNTLGYTGAELSWTLEDNEMVNRTVKSVGARRYKTYRVYQRDL